MAEGKVRIKVREKSRGKVRGKVRGEDRVKVRMKIGVKVRVRARARAGSRVTVRVRAGTMATCTHGSFRKPPCAGLPLLPAIHCPFDSRLHAPDAVQHCAAIVGREPAKMAPETWQRVRIELMASGLRVTAVAHRQSHILAVMECAEG